MSIDQSSLFIDAELALAKAKEKSGGRDAADPREDFDYCFGRILKAARGARTERAGKTPDRPAAERRD